MIAPIACPAAATPADLARFLLECAIAARRSGQQVAPLSLPAGTVRGGCAHASPRQPAGVSDMAPAGAEVAGGGLSSVSMTLTVDQKTSQKAGSHAGLI